MPHFGRRDPLKTPYKAIGAESGEAVYVHRLRAEKALGKPLPKGAEVHHADGSKDEDAPLVICQDRKYHHFLHHRMRVLRAGGNPNADTICQRCQKVKPFESFHKRPTKYLGLREYCKDCVREENARRHIAKKVVLNG